MIRIKMVQAAFGIVLYALAETFDQSKWLGEQGWYFYGRRSNRDLAAKLRDAGLDVNTRWLPVSKKEIAAQILGADGVVFDDNVLALVGDSAAQQIASRSASADVDVPTPDGLAYRPYQLAGVRFALDAFERGQRGVVFGDEMGLGKTMQAIGTAIVTNAQRVLVVCPASLRVNWRNEIAKWWPEIADSIHIVNGGEPFPADARIVVLNYDKVSGRSRNAVALRKSLLAASFDLAIFDEAHVLKNPKAQRTRVFFGEHKRGTLVTPGVVHGVERVLLLTGTPIQNKVRESIELLRVVGALDGGVAADEGKFLFRYCGATKVYTGRRGGMRWSFDGASRLDELQAKLRSGYMIRRLKIEVATELPPKLRSAITIAGHGFAHAVDADFAAQVGSLATETRRFEELSAYRAELAIAKAPHVVAHVADLLEDASRKVIVFGHHRTMLDALSADFGDIAIRIDGSTAPGDRQALVDRFQADPDTRVAILSTHAAGVGLTLTAASVVVFAEADWNPAWCVQAEDRAHRIGQTADVVTVQYLTLDGTLDAHVLATMVGKMDIAERTLDRRNGTDAPAPVAPTPEPAPATAAELTAAAAAALDAGDVAAARAALTAALAALPADDAPAPTPAAPAAPQAARPRSGNVVVDLDGPPPF